MGREVERILKRQYPAIFQDIQLVEYIPAGGKTYRNKASVHDYSRFLYALWKEEIAGAREIKRLMALPGRDRIYTGVRGVPKGTKVYNKTGSTARLCGDMGILNVKGTDGKRYPYTLIGIIEKEQNASDYTSWIRSRGNIIRNVSSIVIRVLPRTTISQPSRQLPGTVFGSWSSLVNSGAGSPSGPTRRQAWSPRPGFACTTPLPEIAFAGPFTPVELGDGVAIVPPAQ